MGSHDVMVVYAYEDQEGEFALKVSKDDVKINTKDDSVSHSVKDDVLLINYKHNNGTTPIYISGGSDQDLLLLVAGYTSATRWWAPIVKDSKDRVLIHGPYLVRGASISGSTLAFTGDVDETTEIQVVAPENIESFTWNDKELKLQKTEHGTWTGTIEFKDPKLDIPDLTKAEWKYSEASPEINPDFDDSSWITANHLQTNSVTIPDTWPVLFADDYGKFITLISYQPLTLHYRFPYWLHLVAWQVQWLFYYHWFQLDSYIR